MEQVLEEGVSVSSESAWPVLGWESRAQVVRTLRPLGLEGKFTAQVRLERDRQKKVGVDDLRAAIEHALRWVGAEGGPGSLGAPKVKRGRKRLSEDIQWVYEALVNESIAGEAPVGAEALLKWARKNPDKFFTMVWSKLLPKVEMEKPEAERFGDDGKPLEGVERLIADCLREAVNGPVGPEGLGGESVGPAEASRKGSRVTRSA